MNKWINVNDALPGHMQVVACHGTFIPGIPYIAIYDSNCKRFLSPENVTMELTPISHWLELPPVPND